MTVWRNGHRLGLAALAAIITACVAAQPNAPEPIAPPDYMLADGQAHYRARIADISAMTPQSSGLLFIGDSITEGGDWAAFFPDFETRNHGIGWDTATGLINRMAQITRGAPQQIYIMIGTNDISYDRRGSVISGEVRQVLFALEDAHPQAQIYLLSVLPRGADKLSNVIGLNVLYKAMATQFAQVEFVDLTEDFAAEDGQLRPDLTYDGLHLNEKGYQVWAQALREYLPQ